MSHKPMLWAALVAGCLSTGLYVAQAATPTPPATKPATQAAEGPERERPARPAAGAESRPATTPARGGRGAAAAAPANLEAAMSDMNRMLSAIKREAADPAQAEQALRDLLTMERDVAISKLLTPPTVNRMPNADEKAKALASYRSMMTGLTRTLLDLEDAVTNKKPDDVKKLIATLDDIEKHGHEEFKAGDD